MASRPSDRAEVTFYIAWDFAAPFIKAAKTTTPLVPFIRLYVRNGPHPETACLAKGLALCKEV